MKFTPEKEKSFDFYCTGIGIDTLFLSPVKTFERDTTEITRCIPSQPGHDALGKVIYPKGIRTDKVYKIE